jgi:poly(3-hydroxybutyrate) depolymerase
MEDDMLGRILQALFGTHVLALAATLGAFSCGGLPIDVESSGVSSEGRITIDPAAIYNIVGVQSAKCVEVQGGSTASMARLQIATCNGTTRQQFQAESMDSGYYRLRNINSGLCVDVSGASTADGAAIIQYPCSNGTNQQWSFTDVSGAERITARSSGKVLDVTGLGTADGTLVEQWTWNGGDNQLFRMEVVGDGGSGGSGGSGGGAPSAGCGTSPTLTSGTHWIQSGGQSRSFMMRIPDNYDPNHPYRLIFAFHWNGGTAGDVDGGGTSGFTWSYYGLRERADNSTIFVAPQGINNGWANTGGRDLTFVDDMVRLIEADLCVDTTRLFSMGFSYGGGMSFEIACARATTFRAVAVYSGAQLSGCDGGNQPIAYMGIHGIRDPICTIAGGRALRDRFVANNGCTPQNAPEPAMGSLTHIVTSYSGCRPGYPVVWAAFDGGGHTPAPVDGSTADSGGGDRTWTKAEVWQFFTQF